jgi:hypothetical protein
LKETRRFRESSGLDLDLGGDRRAISHRIKALQRAWQRGNPVARWSASTFSALLRPADATELEYRERYIAQADTAIPRWAEKHAGSTYAGWDIEPEKYGGTIFVGFTEDQASFLAALKREVKLIAPERIELFPIAPTFTIDELEDFEEDPKLFKGEIGNLINSVAVDVLANRVEVGTEHVARVRKLLAERYGAEAPYLVVFESSALLLRGRSWLTGGSGKRRLADPVAVVQAP